MEGVLYPRAGRDRNGEVTSLHHHLVLSLLGESKIPASYHVSGLKKEISEARPHTIVLSSEVLSREYLSSQVFRDLQAMFPNAKREWIIFLRRQDKLAASRYAEMIKVGILKWPDGIRSVILPYYLDHRLRLERLRYAVKSDRILAISFEDVQPNVVDGFLRNCKLPSVLQPNTSRRLNESYPWGVLHMLRLANALPPRVGSLARRGILSLGLRLARTQLRALVNWGYPLSEEKANWILGQYASSNRWVEEQYLAGRPLLSNQAVKDVERSVGEII